MFLQVLFVWLLMPSRELKLDVVAPNWFAEIMGRLTQRAELAPEQVRLFMQEVMSGRAGDVETAAVLAALRVKGETAGELAAAAGVLREQMIPLDTGGLDALDTCGTGGDETGTFNISTVTALVVAAAGVPVAKHGNRAVSSQSGSADVLAALGLAADLDPATSARSLREVGLAFCFAPRFHPALRHVAPLRRRMRMRTLFNWLGPLANPARTPYQLLGVGQMALLDVLAHALARLGTRHAYLVCSRDGLDEVSLSAPTCVREVRGQEVIAHEWTPEQFGLPQCRLADLKVATAAASAALIEGILGGAEIPAACVVVANAAAALLAAERVSTLADGVAAAHAELASGRARQKLEQLRVWHARA